MNRRMIVVNEQQMAQNTSQAQRVITTAGTSGMKSILFIIQQITLNVYFH